MYKLYTDKVDNFQATIKLEGASPSKSKAPPSRVNKFDPWVRVTSPLLKLITAPDEPNNKSSPIV